MILGKVSDLSDQFIATVLERAAALADGSPRIQAPAGSLLGLLFLDTSLRTRVGFAAAAGQMGMAVVEVQMPRGNERSAPESLDHTLRVLTGYTNAVVARIPTPISGVRYSGSTPVINGGDGGDHSEHPTQALIDVFAIERQSGRPIEELVVAMCGDLTMRAPRSLLALFGRRTPRELLLITEPGLGQPDVPNELRPLTRYAKLTEVDGVDVLYVAGIPHLALPPADRARLIVTVDILERMQDDSFVLCPMPVIDEITDEAMWDQRMGFLRQSDDALAIRIAVLERVVTGF